MTQNTPKAAIPADMPRLLTRRRLFSLAGGALAGSALAAPALLGSAGPARAAPIPLSEISAYFNRLGTLKARFSQVNDDGSTSAGTLWIKRPGKMRFEYDPPVEALVLAGQGAVAIYDGRSLGGPETYPLSQTPLGLILDDTVDLGSSQMVIAHVESGAATVIRAQDPARPEYGYIDLAFTANPLALRQWATRDGQGTETQVSLSDVQTGLSLSDSMFNIRNETGVNPRDQR